MGIYIVLIVLRFYVTNGADFLTEIEFPYRKRLRLNYLYVVR